MRKAVIAASLAVLLAACGGETEGSTDTAEGSSAGDDAASGGDLSMAEVAERAREGTVRPQPGQYRSQVELVDLDIPGAPPQAAEMMRGQMSQTTEFCLTQEDVEEGFRQLASQPQGGDCSFNKFDVDGGEIDAAMSCTNPGGGTVNISMQGTGRETSSEFTMRMSGDLGGTGEGSMTMKQTSERIGDCSAG